MGVTYMIVELYFSYIFMLSLSTYMVVKLIKKYFKGITIINYDKIDKGFSEHFKNNKKTYELLYQIFFYLIIALTLYTSTYIIVEIPNIIQGKYITDVCIVDGISDEENTGSKGIICHNKKNEKIEFSYYGNSIEKGVVVKIEYYKNIKVGNVYSIE